MPDSQLTRELAQTIARAAEAEDLALRELRDALGESGGAAGGRLEGDLEGDAVPQEGSLGPFLPFETQIVETNGLRRQALEDLADVVRDTSEESEAAVDEFATRYGALAGRWDKFHQDYDQWRGTEGGCDRSEVAKALGQFALTFGGLADRVRALPRATFLRPMGELFVEAAEREEEAIRRLRNTWRPFDPHFPDQPRGAS